MEEKVIGCGCVAQVVILLLYALLGAASVNWLLVFFTGKVLPVWAAAIVGLIGGSVTIPAAIIIYLLRMFGIM